MAMSLYDVTVPIFAQTLGAVAAFVEKAEAHCAAKGVSEEEYLGARLYDDMLPFSYQVKSTAVHSADSLEAVKAGVFAPNMAPPPATFAALKDRIATARATLDRYTPAEINALEGRDMRFEMGDRRMDFVSQDFLLSFSLPNFFFHATTAYAILRNRGLELGKRDFMGPIRLKR